MNLILAVPVGVRLALLFGCGVCAGGVVNWGVYRLACFARPISPWSPAAPEAPPRRWTDRIPLFGWLGLRRESGLHGTCFWLRPMLVELLAGVGCAWLYWWEVKKTGVPSWSVIPSKVQICPWMNSSMAAPDASKAEASSVLVGSSFALNAASPAASVTLEIDSTDRPPTRSICRPTRGPSTAEITSDAEKAANIQLLETPRSWPIGSAKIAGK